MNAPLVVVTGTGTGIGKTHVAAALVRAWAALLLSEGRPAEVAGLKPVESGVTPGTSTDAQTLEQASTFHVKRFPPPYLLARAVSPHLAAAGEGRQIGLGPVVAYVDEVRASADAVVVELAGGLFTPLAPSLSNAELAVALRPSLVLLVAPDRLGVLHDIGASTRAAEALGLTVDGVLLVAMEEHDASTGTNAGEVAVVTDVPLVGLVSREAVTVTAARPELAAFLRRCDAAPRAS